MAKELKKIFEDSSDEIVQGFTIQSWHVSQSVDALTGAEDYDITISGSLTLTGSMHLDGIEDAGGNSVYNIVIDQTSGQVFTTSSLGGGGGSDGSSGTSGVAGSSGTSGTGSNGSSGTSGATGSSGTSGTGLDGSSGTSGTGGDGANGALIFPYQYNTSGIGSPPSGDLYIKSGFVILNPTDSIGTDLGDFYDTVEDYGIPGTASGDNKAILKLEKADDPTNFILYNVYRLTSGANSATTYVTTLVNPGYNFSHNDDILVSFNLIGPEGTSGAAGSSGTSGTGSDGSSGTSGTGSDGSSGTSGQAGSSGTSGQAGSSGTSGQAGSSGTSGSGSSGTSGSSGSSGTSGEDGSSGTSANFSPHPSLGTQNTGTSGFTNGNVPDDSSLTASGWLTVDLNGTTYYIPVWTGNE